MKLYQCIENVQIKNMYLSGIQYEVVSFQGQDIDISQYNEQIHKNKITCEQGHEMVYIEGKQVRSHFRHKKQEEECDSDYNNEWHKEIQGYFAQEKREVKIGQNRTDVLLNENAVLEIQHSYITQEQVQQRNKNYIENGKLTIYWVDGRNLNINVNENVKQRYQVRNSILNALKEEQVPVYLDLREFVWRIVIIKSQQNKLYIEFKYKKTREQLVNDLLNHNGKFDDLYLEADKCSNCKEETILNYKFDICEKCYQDQRNISIQDWKPMNIVRQAGAGNAKTYTAVKEALLNLEKYENVLFLVKTNGTKQIIIDKINEVWRDFQDKLQDWEWRISEQHLNIYFMSFNSKNKQTEIVIGTVDSFFCSISHQHGLKLRQTKYSEIDYQYNAQQIGENELFTQELFYKKILIKQERFDTLLILDEAQDLHIDYTKALFNLFDKYSMDFIIIGDKLQTINLDTYNTKSPMTEYAELLKQKYDLEVEIQPNICRRLQSKRNGPSSQNMIRFINNFVPFEQFGLQPLQNEVIETKENDVFLFNHAPTRSLDSQSIESNINIILNIFRDICTKGEYYPDDFQIILPALKNINSLKDIENAINQFWINEFQSRREYNTNIQQKYLNYNEQCEFCELHLSENGTLIDLSTSLKKTRIYSIHASKGEGRTVSILIDFTTNSLECHQTLNGDLKYESLIHVALTRQKKYLFIGTSQKSGDVYDRLQISLEKGFIQEISTDIIQNIKEEVTLKNKTIYQLLKSANKSRYNNIIQIYESSLKRLFSDIQFTLEQIETELLQEISEMIDNYELPLGDVDQNDYEIKTQIFAYHIKQQICKLTFKGQHILKSLYYQGNIFDNVYINQVFNWKEYIGLLDQKNKIKGEHAINYNFSCKNPECPCRQKYIQNNTYNKVIQQICLDINKIFKIMYEQRFKNNKTFEIKCPIQMIIAIYFIYQDKYLISPVKLYSLMIKIKQGLFNDGICKCNICSEIKQQEYSNINRFYREIFNPQIIQNITPLINEINIQNLKQNQKLAVGLEQNENIKINTTLELYDEQTNSSIYIISKLTDSNFREILFRALIDCYILYIKKKTNGKMNAIIISSNNQFKKESGDQQFATNFIIDIKKKKIQTAIEYLIVLMKLRDFDTLFDQFLLLVQKKQKIETGLLSPIQLLVYDYIKNKYKQNSSKFIGNINEYKNKCFMKKILKLSA